MPFVKISGFVGKVYVPENKQAVRKHNCKDCFICQLCSDERCEKCVKSHCRNKERENIICDYNS